MENKFTKIKLDVFSLNWLGTNPEKSRSAGMMSITYHEKLNVELMKQTVLNLFAKYPFFCCNLEKEGKYFYFKVPSSTTEGDIENRIHFSTKTQDEIFDDVSMMEINLYEDDLYQIYFLDHEDSFDIIIYGAHLIGDGLTSATGLSILLNNYYVASRGMLDLQIFPDVEYKQLLEYGFKMRYNRFGILWVPRWLRFIPGYFTYKRNTKFDVPKQIFNEPVQLDEPLLRIDMILQNPFNDLLDLLKQKYEVNSNHLILSLISYSLLKSQNYERAITTYPINIRNKYGFEAGNLLTANRIEILYYSDFIIHLLETRNLLEKEKNRTGPYYAISLGKFVKNDYGEMKKRMSKVVQQSNLRFSNVGGLPAPNLDIIDNDLFNKIPLSDYHANALPLRNIGVHFFITSLKNNLLTNYYLTILHSEKTVEPLHKVITILEETIIKTFEILN